MAKFGYQRIIGGKLLAWMLVFVVVLSIISPTIPAGAPVTVILDPQYVTIDDYNLEHVVHVSGTAEGPVIIHFTTEYIWLGLLTVYVPLDSSEIRIIAKRPTDPGVVAETPFVISVSRQRVTESLVVNLALTSTWQDIDPSADAATHELMPEGFGNPIGADSPCAFFQGVLEVTNIDGPTLTYHRDSGIRILREVETGLYFKDLNRNGVLDCFEDWRKSTHDRAVALAEMLPLDRQFALMAHDRPDEPTMRCAVSGEYVVPGGWSLDGSFADGRRFAWSAPMGAPADAAALNNRRQFYAENDIYGFGIPFVTATDPIHTGRKDTGNPEWTGLFRVSVWPATMGLAAQFCPDLMWEYGRIVSAEYRAMGVQMMVAPQIDLVTDPRWGRAAGSLTEDLYLNEALGSAFITSLQTTDRQVPLWGINDGWGMQSVATQAKHWPSGGNGEFGFDGHHDVGKFGVHPGDFFMVKAESFAEAAGLAHEHAGTPRQSAALMSYYTIPFGQDPSGENVGMAFSEWIMVDLLREKYNYDGMVITDFGIQGDPRSRINAPWGVDDERGYSVNERVLRLILMENDQQGFPFVMGGGEGGRRHANGLEMVTEAFEYGVANGFLTQDEVEAIAFTAAVRVLRIMFNLGLFESAYTCPVYARNLVGSSELNDIAHEIGHLPSVIMLKNANDTLPIQSTPDDRPTVFIALNDDGAPVVNLRAAHQHFDIPEVIWDAAAARRGMTEDEVVQAMAEADFAILRLRSPYATTRPSEVPQSLIFGPYTAVWQREHSIGYDWVDADGALLHRDVAPDPALGHFQTNRSFRGRTNPGTPDAVRHLETMAAHLNGTPLVFILDMVNPMVPAEFEPMSSAILAGTEVSDAAFLAVIAGHFNPTGLLPATMPINMATVELGYEDMPHVMVPYFDSEGNHYAFGFGLTFDDAGNTVRIGVDTEDMRFNRFLLNNRHVQNGNIARDLTTHPRSEIRPLIILTAQIAEILDNMPPNDDPTLFAQLQEAHAAATALIESDPLQIHVDEMESRLWGLIDIN